MTEKESIHLPLHKSLAPSCVHLIGYSKSSSDKHINSLPAVPGMSVPIKIFVCLRYGTVWKVELSSTLPVPQADCRRYLGQVFPLKKTLPGHVPGTTAGTPEECCIFRVLQSVFSFVQRIFSIVQRIFSVLCSVYFPFCAAYIFSFVQHIHTFAE